MVVIVFVSRNSGNTSNYKPQSLSLSYAQSLSAELTENGWKPIYIHSWSARMPVEEMDYLLEKYWYPKVKGDVNEQHQTVDNIDIKSLKKKSRLMIEKNQEKRENAKTSITLEI